MKTTIALSTLALTLSSFMPVSTADHNHEHANSELVARKVLHAFQFNLITEYQQLFPKLKDFYQLMDADATVYGPTLDAAKRDFARVYLEEVYPALSRSFERIIKEGKEKGIDWGTAELVRVEYANLPQGKFGKSNLEIVFTSDGVLHTLAIEQALIINGEWKVSQFAKLI
jgi:hypothetical protein